jgi:hypothetical protein
VAEEIIQLEQWRVRLKGGRAASQPGQCGHHNLTMDPHGQTVRCEDCKLQLSAYWVLESVVESYRRARTELDLAKAVHLQKVRAEVGLLAAQRVNTAWRSRHMVPTCPHCARGIFPEDGFGTAMIPKALELARRRRGAAQHNATVAEVEPIESRDQPSGSTDSGDRTNSAVGSAGTGGGLTGSEFDCVDGSRP